MANIELSYSKVVIKGNSADVLSPSEFLKFNPSVLGLGNIKDGGTRRHALAAIFDLEGFTSFCNQADPHLMVPDYVSEFLDWLFNEMSREFVMTEEQLAHHDITSPEVALKLAGGDKILWSRFPFFAKFLGDGILFIWDTKGMDDSDLGNAVVSLNSICESYKKSFYKKFSTEFALLPKKLRCGVARGIVISIGDGSDYIGPCINIAARLQKIGSLCFAFLKKGFNMSKCFTEKEISHFVNLQVSIRGIGEEIIVTNKSDYDDLPDDEKDRLKKLG